MLPSFTILQQCRIRIGDIFYSYLVGVNCPTVFFLSDQADFQWASQLKQRFKGESGHSSDPKLPLATIDILDASFEYGFEFLGNGPRLVITPLTDRIYVTATQVRVHRSHFSVRTRVRSRRHENVVFVQEEIRPTSVGMIST